MTAPITIGTFNIRLDIASDGPNAWPRRCDAVRALIEREVAFDVVGLQEALAHQVAFLAESERLAYVGVGREDGKAVGEFAPIFFDHRRFDLRDSGTFWLSESPDTPSFGWDASFPRICTWAHLHEREGTDTAAPGFYVFNTHFDHRGSVARERSAALLLDRIATITGATGNDLNNAPPLFLLGDFNLTPETAPIQRLASRLAPAQAVSESPAEGPTGTFTGFDAAHSAEEQIDHVFINRRVRILRHIVLPNERGAGLFVSDHRPVIVSAELLS